MRRHPFVLTTALILMSGSWAVAQAPVAGMGIMVGEVTPESALVQVRLTKTDRLVEGDVPGMAGLVEFTLARADEKGDLQIQIARAVADHDFIARAPFRNLQPGTNYVCTTQIGTRADDLKDGPTARFKTLPGPKQAEPVRFVVVTGMNYAKFHGDDRIDRERHKIQNNTELPPPYAGPDKHLGYPSLKSILDKKPDFFVGTGDNVYYDTPTEPRAKTITEMRQKWHEQFVQPRYRDLFAAVPTYWEIDDHDYRIDDSDNSGDYEPSPELGRRMMLEQLPVAPMDDQDAKTYRTYRISRDLQVWFTENRMYRSPNEMPDGPDKTIWGQEQKEWLKRTLKESDATFKLVISPTPMVGPDDLRKKDNHTNVGGFQHERDEFFKWLTAAGGLVGNGFHLITGDRHWQYHAIDPTGVNEFSCGALVDANSRLGRKPGDPKSTDPEGKIKQPYYQDPASGGFLWVAVEPLESGGAELQVRWYNTQGKLLHKYDEKQGVPPVRDDPPQEEPNLIRHEIQDMEGWQVHVDESLLSEENRELGKTASRILRDKLHRITMIMKPEVLKKLREVPIFLDHEHPLKSLQYHPSVGWLRSHGYDPAMRQSVHIPRAEGLVSHERRQDQPWVMLHELAHAYHDRVLGFDDEDILGAYERAKEAKLYEDVLHIRGHRSRHYALTNHKEFFAEMTESYFGTNDFYPFVRGELREYDPATFTLLEKIWGKR